MSFSLSYYKTLYFTVTIETDERTKWIKLNAGQVGYYRVNYNEEWITFKELLRSQHMVESVFSFNTRVIITRKL